MPEYSNIELTFNGVPVAIGDLTYDEAKHDSEPVFASPSAQTFEATYEGTFELTPQEHYDLWRSIFQSGRKKLSRETRKAILASQLPAAQRHPSIRVMQRRLARKLAKRKRLQKWAQGAHDRWTFEVARAARVERTHQEVAAWYPREGEYRKSILPKLFEMEAFRRIAGARFHHPMVSES